MNMEGQITSTASQNIYLSDSQTISQVLVKEGDVVNAGDTADDIRYQHDRVGSETQQLQLAQTKLKIQQSEKELEKLKKTKPVADTPLDPVEPDFRISRIFQMNPSIRISRTNRFRPQNRSRRTRMLFCTAALNCIWFQTIQRREGTQGRPIHLSLRTEEQSNRRIP